MYPQKIKKVLILAIILNLLIPNFLFAADFNPNFLLSDEEMQNWQAMSREDIAAFLSGKGGYISTLKIEDKDGTIRDTADIISRAAQEHKINPKYILVKLQKEQSLVTDDDPTQKQLDWATGYSVCDSCSMDDPAIQKNKGFGKQVDASAGIIRWYYENVSAQNWIKRAQNEYAIDDTLVRPANNATAFLYTYTPHIHGNKNFWTLWQKWFDQVYPDGTLIKAKDDPTIYLIQEGKKRPFKSMAALNTRYNAKLLIEAPASELGRYEVGRPIALANFSLLKNGGNYYLLDDDTLRPFDSFETVKKLGYHPDEIIDITTDDIAGYAIGRTISETETKPAGRVVQLKENKAVYYIKDNTYHSLPDLRMAKINFPHLTVETVSAASLADLAAGQPILPKDGTLFMIDGDTKVFVMENGTRRHIATEQVFTGLGYSWKNIIKLNEFAVLNVPAGEPLYVRLEPAATASPATPPASPTKTTNSPAPATTSPAPKDIMYRAPKEQTAFVGPEFSTQVDTYLVAEYDTGTVLAGKNIDFVRPIASFAKVMTAYQVLKDGIQLSAATTYNDKKHKPDYDKYLIGNGDQVLNKDLMSALLVSSLNTPAYMLAMNVAPDKKTFLARMNAQAKEMGLTKTMFTDPSGYDLGTVSTAREYLAIFRKGAGNIDVLSYMAMPSYTYKKVANVSGKKEQHYDDHSNHLMQKTNLQYNILGSKTGYLNEAGAGLVMLVERKTDGKKFVIITMGNPDYPNRFVEPNKLTEWALKNF